MNQFEYLSDTVTTIEQTKNLLLEPSANLVAIKLNDLSQTPSKKIILFEV